MASNVIKTHSVKTSLESHEARKHTRRGMETRSGANEGTPSGHTSRYHIIKTIGKGNFAKVKLAKHILTGQEVAIKIIDKTHMNATSLQKLRREVRIMKLLDHPNIVKLYEVIETEKSLNLVMEYASRGELFDYLVANGRMKEKDARVLFRQIISAIQYCHQKRILHRDLKAENLLLDEDLNVKIADFGFSNEFSLNSKLDTFCGSPPYAAPELFQGKKYDGPEVDVWSLGVILYTLVSGSLPFDGQNLKELRERVLRGKYRIPFYMTTDCENLLKKFLVLNPLKRASLETVMKDLWLNTGFEDNKIKPFSSPLVTTDPRIIDKMVLLGLKRRDVEESLNNKTYNHIMATYLLLCRQSAIAKTTAAAAGRGGSGGGGRGALVGGNDEDVSKISSVLRTTSVNNHKNNNNTCSNNNHVNPPLIQQHKPTHTTNDPPPTTTTTKVSRSASAAASNIDKRILRKDVQENFPGIQKTPNELQLNATMTTTTTTPTTLTTATDYILPSTALHNSINVPLINSSNPASNPTPSNFFRATNVRTTLPPPSFQSSEHITPHNNNTPNNSTLLNQSLLQDTQFTTPSISRSVRKSFLHRISSKFYRNKSNRKSEGMVKTNNNKNTTNNRLPQHQQSTAASTTTTPTSTTPTTTTTSNNNDLNNSLAYINTPSLKHSNDTFTSIATNSTTTTEKSIRPRALHFTWHLRNTSPAEADKMITQIRQVLDFNHCDYYQTTPFVVHCSHSSACHNDHVAMANKGGSEVEWLMEVCRLPRLSMNGVKFKRVSGSPLIYKNILTKVSNELRF